MVKISYCSNCHKAYRFHLKKKSICGTCKEPFEIIDVSRTKYFLIQLPILILGFIVIGYSIINLSLMPKKFVEFLGIFIFGFALVLFALAFQMLDNKAMEQLANEKGTEMFSSTESEEIIKKTQFKFPKKQPAKIRNSKPIPMAKSSFEPEDLFIKPNKPKLTQGPSKKEPISRMESTQVKLEELIKPKSKKKKARKIRRAR